MAQVKFMRASKSDIKTMPISNGNIIETDDGCLYYDANDVRYNAVEGIDWDELSEYPNYFFKSGYGLQNSYTASSINATSFASSKDYLLATYAVTSSTVDKFGIILNESVDITNMKYICCSAAKWPTDSYNYGELYICSKKPASYSEATASALAVVKKPTSRDYIEKYYQTWQIDTSTLTGEVYLAMFMYGSVVTSLHTSTALQIGDWYYTE